MINVLKKNQVWVSHEEWDGLTFVKLDMKFDRVIKREKGFAKEIDLPLKRVTWWQREI